MKTTQKNKTLHRQLHPVHWHVSMFVAIAAILLTSFKTSTEMLRALQALPMSEAVMDSVHMREAETRHAPIILNIGARVATFGGK